MSNLEEYQFYIHKKPRNETEKLAWLKATYVAGAVSVLDDPEGYRQLWIETYRQSLDDGFMYTHTPLTWERLKVIGEKAELSDGEMHDLELSWILARRAEREHAKEEVTTAMKKFIKKVRIT